MTSAFHRKVFLVINIRAGIKGKKTKANRWYENEVWSEIVENSVSISFYLAACSHLFTDKQTVKLCGLNWTLRQTKSAVTLIHSPVSLWASEPGPRFPPPTCLWSNPAGPAEDTSGNPGVYSLI